MRTIIRSVLPVLSATILCIIIGCAGSKQHEPSIAPLPHAPKKEGNISLKKEGETAAIMMVSGKMALSAQASVSLLPPAPTVETVAPDVLNTEEYDRIRENPFRNPLESPLSTFSIDVDAASYANARRYLNNGSLPPMDAVRIEELVNYFSYNYPQPGREHPFSVTTEISTCPWEPGDALLHIGLQGRTVDMTDLPANNLVFLLDVSGSMNAPNKLPLLKKTLRMLTAQLRDKDRVAIIVYAGAAGLVLPATPGSEKKKIMQAFEGLAAGGSTAGGAGIELAYKTAAENFITDGNNRVILATDGDFNVGTSSDAAMVRLIEEKKNTGVFLTVLGFGMGNLKDAKLEQISGYGNGNYAYIDNLTEAKKALVTEIGSTLLTIAKDVKIQVEFNSAAVSGYRLIGYENRMLKREDFDNDKKDAGELGAGHSVTAVYQLKLSSGSATGSDSLKYTQTTVRPGYAGSNELATVRLRYKAPADTLSKKLEVTVAGTPAAFGASSEDNRFSAAVAAWGMLLRNSKYTGNATFSMVTKTAGSATGNDRFGYRAEFLKLIEKSSDLRKK